MITTNKKKYVFRRKSDGKFYMDCGRGKRMTMRLSLATLFDNKTHADNHRKYSWFMQEIAPKSGWEIVPIIVEVHEARHLMTEVVQPERKPKDEV